MYCKKCGTNIPNNAKFCSKCGETVSRKAVKNKKPYKIASLVTSLVIFIGTCSGIFAFRKDIFSFFLENKDVYSEDELNETDTKEFVENCEAIDSSLNSFMSSEEYSMVCKMIN